MHLKGIYIQTKNRKKFVAKIGVCPIYKLVPDISNKIILYKEVPWSDFCSYTTKSVGMDTAAWQEAQKYDVEYLVVWCPDVQGLAIVSAYDMNHFSFNLDLGEYLQTRVGEKRCKRYKGAPKINLGYTQPENDVTINPIPIKTI